MSVRFVTFAAVFSLATGCGTAEEASFFMPDGSQGGDIDIAQQRVFFGMDSMVCGMGEDQVQEDIPVDEDEKPIVVDSMGKDVLFVDGAHVSIVDTEWGAVTDIPVEGDGNVSDASFVDDGWAILLEDCNVKFHNGETVELPGSGCFGELIEGDVLYAQIDGDGVYIVDPERGATRIGGFHTASWDANNGQLLLGEGSTVSGYSDGAVKWTYDHDEAILDVFPFLTEAGFRDTAGRVFSLKPSDDEATHRLTIPPYGTALGTVGNSLAVLDYGVILYPIP